MKIRLALWLCICALIHILQSVHALAGFSIPSRIMGLSAPRFLLAETPQIKGDSAYVNSGAAMARAVKIMNVVGGKIVGPLVSSLLKDGFPNDWDSFWSRETDGIGNAERITLALEDLGPTYVKFGQALGSRPDIIPESLADALAKLQDDMKPFDTETAKAIIRQDLSAAMNEEDMTVFVDNLGEVVGSASIGQVYKGFLPNYGPVAVKVQRPGIRSVVEQDAKLLRTLATWLESIPALPLSNDRKKGPNRLIATDLVDGVEEFMSRIFEELDYRNEVCNVEAFAQLYCGRRGSLPTLTGKSAVQVVVPEIRFDLCTENVIVMEWLEGTKLTDVDADDECAIAENIELIEKGIECTLHQLLSSGTVHADPHGGNLLKVKHAEGTELGYLDFGLLSTVPTQVRDALICSVASLVFARDVEAVASLFSELNLVPDEVVSDPDERLALTAALDITMSESLEYPGHGDSSDEETQIPKLKFDKLLDALTRLIPRFQFQLPPYFINNARAMSTLEGIARSLDPDFNVLQVMYPYALNRLLSNPTDSPVVEQTMEKLIRSPETGLIEPRRLTRLLTDAALISGQKRVEVVHDVMKTKGGKRFASRMLFKEVRLRFRRPSKSRGSFFRLFRL